MMQTLFHAGFPSVPPGGRRGSPLPADACAANQKATMSTGRPAQRCRSMTGGSKSWIDATRLAQLLLVSWILAGGVVDPDAIAAAEPPNIIVILVDDLGVGDCGFSGCVDVPTPCMDRFAKQGVVCTNAYVTPSCSPTRAALLTGRYPSRFGIEDNRPLDGPTAGMDLGEVLLPQLLRDGGYATAMVGKWHLGRGPHGPQARGFDEFFGWIGASGTYINPLLLCGDDPTPEPTVGWVDDILADRAAAFIADHVDRPFFLHVAFMAAHLKQQAYPEDFEAFAHLPGSRRMAAAIISRLDRAVGRLLDAIHQADLEEKTLVFLLSDNGGEPSVLGTSNGTYRGEKFDVLEGGIRVPFALRWPDVLPAGKTFAPMVHGMDVFATAAAAAGVIPPKPLDGVNLVPFLRGDSTQPPHERLFWVYNDHADWRRTDQDTNLARRLLAVREGNWKLVLEGDAQPQLYDIATDPGETHDLAATEPGRLADLVNAITDWDRRMVRQVIPPDHPIYGRDRKRPVSVP
jgi:arylsulfatase A-like enzyme